MLPQRSHRFMLLLIPHLHMASHIAKVTAIALLFLRPHALVIAEAFHFWRCVIPQAFTGTKYPGRETWNWPKCEETKDKWGFMDLFFRFFFMENSCVFRIPTLGKKENHLQKCI